MAAVFATMVSASVAPFLVGSLSIQIGESIRFTPTDVGIAVAAYYVVSAALSPLAGQVVTTLGPTASLRLASAGSTLSLVLVAVADSAATVIVALALLGAPNSLVQPSSNQVLSTVADPGARGLGFGVVQSAIPLSTMLSGVLLAVFGDAASWRHALWTVAVLTLAGQLLIARADAGAPSTTATRPPAPGARPIGGAPLMVAMVAGAFLASLAATTLPSFVALTGEQRDLSPGSIAAAQIAGSLACVAVRIVAAWRGGGTGGPRRMLGSVAGLLLLGSTGFLFLAWNGAAWAFAVGVVLAYAFGWGWNGLFNLSVSRVRAGRVPASTGLTQGGVFLGGACGPLLFAAVSSHEGYGAGWITVAIAAFASSLCVAHAMRRWVGEKEERHEPVG
ncbi:MFS transporter [Streptomyces radicis]|uniref:MFS transporter n=1 Tax=Streptomyces radicis TaxID=1750517 RepID=A0ABX9RQA5_9ACTN|nr:MFS transporter [Streptomyces radicis]